MPQLAYATPRLDDGTANPNVASGTVLLTARGLAPNARLTITAKANAVTETYATAADANGNASYVIAPVDPLLQAYVAYLGSGGGWGDKASKWIVTASDPANGNSGSLTIEAAP